MWEWMKKLVSREPAVDVEAQPVEVNAPIGDRSRRNNARMQRLKQLIQAGDTRQELKDELARRERWGR